MCCLRLLSAELGRSKPSAPMLGEAAHSNFANNLFASACDSRRPIIACGTFHLLGSSWPSVIHQFAAHRPGQCNGPSNLGTELRSLTHACCERTNICRRGTSSFRWRSDPSRTL